MKLSKSKVEINLARNGMNARELRSKGISSTTLTRAMQGRSITAKSAGRIAKAIGVDITEIIEKED